MRGEKHVPLKCKHEWINACVFVSVMVGCWVCVCVCVCVFQCGGGVLSVVVSPWPCMYSYALVCVCVCLCVGGLPAECDCQRTTVASLCWSRRMLPSGRWLVVRAGVVGWC